MIGPSPSGAFSRARHGTALACLVVVVVGLAAAAAPLRADEPAPPKVAPAAWEQAAGGPADMLVVLGERADLSAARELREGADKRRFVFLALKATADHTQASVRAWLGGRGISYRPYYIVNALWTRGDRNLMRELALRPEVERIEANPRVRMALPAPSSFQPKTLEWNVIRVGAPDVWAQGHMGEGIVVSDQDTGVRWTHESLRPHYRGWNGFAADHDYNWHDAIHDAAGNACGNDAPEPCDDFGHGSHTIGTAVGGDGTNEIGVAPRARWIACRNMDDGFGTPARYLECFEFSLAPWPLAGTAADGDPTLGADITTNSWLCPPGEGCAWDVLADGVSAQRAAGIMTVVAAGNSGSGCSTIDNPPAEYDDSYTVGATDSGDNVTGFSSRGPAPHTGLIKPDIVAPGAGVRSSLAGSDSEYASWSGTSMATPHVAGCVALLWSAVPTYRNQIDQTEALLNRTAVRLTSIVEGCGGDYIDGPNDTWGHGRIDVAAAVRDACAPTETNCTNAFDDDCDSRVDCADSDCAGDAACPEAGNCTDGVDNDLDLVADCADPDCAGDAACPEAGNCADRVDNDIDGLTDCADPDCAGDAACPEAGNCTDRVDNDVDGLTDCADSECAGDAACPEAGNCADRVDNDLDALTDCADPDCAGDAACPEAGNCADGVDNDLDALADCADTDCSGDAACPETGNCTDGVDNDLDGLTDCADPDCAGDIACPETGNCTDSVDNDLDGLTDCADPECVGEAACAGADTDGDGHVNAEDCLPLDPGAFAVPPEVPHLDVTKPLGGGGELVSWVDVSALAGTATVYDVASGPLSQLRVTGAASGTCIGQDAPPPSLADTRTISASFWYLVRAVNGCGPPANSGWGTDSRGNPRLGCR